jgi:hypothetical protein
MDFRAVRETTDLVGSGPSAFGGQPMAVFERIVSLF